MKTLAALCLLALAVTPASGLSLVAVGDVMLDRGVAAVAAERGYDWLFDPTRDLLAEADLAFCNLECPLSADAPRLPKRITFRGDPAAAGALARAGFDVVSLANNHTMDCGSEGLLDTFAALEGAGLRWVGAGNDRGEAEAPLVLERDGLRIAFIARSLFAPESVSPENDAPTIATLEVDELVSAVAECAEDADVVVVSLHWGIEFTEVPTAWQREVAHALADAGADLILGHHPHTVQRVERYGNAIIAYSLGNFVFDMSGPRGGTGLVLLCDIGPEGLREFVPTQVTLRDCQPEPQGRARATE